MMENTSINTNQSEYKVKTLTVHCRKAFPTLVTPLHIWADKKASLTLLLLSSSLRVSCLL
jgi:hypothetical protein